MEHTALLYEGKTKKVYETDDPQQLILSYKDDAAPSNGLKKGTIGGKGAINNHMTNLLMTLLEQQGIPTHLIRELNAREALVKRVTIIPLEVIVRNIAAGSFSKRYGVDEGVVLDRPTVEFFYKNGELGNPLLNTSHAITLRLATPQELETMHRYALAINEFLKNLWEKCGITLVDFKLEFGRLSDGTVVLADEISPDTCRLWDVKTREKLDKERFRLDLGCIEDAYNQVMIRLLQHTRPAS